MNKKLILIALGAGFVIFLVMIAAVYFLTPMAEPVAATDPNQIAAPQNPTPSPMGGPGMADAKALFSGGSSVKRNLTETQLKSLIFEARDNIKLYKTKLLDLQIREQRLLITQAVIRQDVEELSNLRIELASTVTALRDERDKLSQSLIEIGKTETANLQQIAATYDKMDPISAGKILLNMSQSQNGSSGDDAIKILYYMTERVKAEVLASIAETEPGISAFYCSELKQVVVRE